MRGGRDIVVVRRLRKMTGCAGTGRRRLDGGVEPFARDDAV